MRHRYANPHVIALLEDLIFGTKIRFTAESVGVALTTTHSAVGLDEALSEKDVSLLIVDLNLPGDIAFEAIRIASQHPARPRILAYVAHVDRHLADRARQAGVDDVLPRSRFAATLPEILSR